MKTLKKVEIEPIYVDFIPEIREQNKIYISEKYNCAVHNCLCGCGAKTIMPLYDGGWILIKEVEGKVSFIPSVGNYYLPCNSHYIITKNIANFV